jgi:NAD+ kinase
MTTFGLVAAQSKPEASELAAEITSLLIAKGCDVLDEVQLDAGAYTKVDAVVVLGGDGLMMRIANRYVSVPLLGINFGKVGFLAAVERRDWQEAINALVDGEYRIEDGATLAASVARGSETLDAGWAINDVVIRSGGRMIDIEVYFDGRYVNTYPGDGMITATPRGSTAYGMAAGGPILTAGVHGFAIVPISCHSPIRTPLVVAEETVIELFIASEHEASLILDGRPILDLKRGDMVQVCRGEHAFRLVTLPTTNSLEAFRTKFNFQIRPDAVPTRPKIPMRGSETPVID